MRARRRLGRGPRRQMVRGRNTRVSRAGATRNECVLLTTKRALPTFLTGSQLDAHHPRQHTASAPGAGCPPRAMGADGLRCGLRATRRACTSSTFRTARMVAPEPRAVTSDAHAVVAGGVARHVTSTTRRGSDGDDHAEVVPARSAGPRTCAGEAVPGSRRSCETQRRRRTPEFEAYALRRACRVARLGRAARGAPQTVTSVPSNLRSVKPPKRSLKTRRSSAR